MYPDWQYPAHAGGFKNPLASTYLNPTVGHIEELSKKVPNLGAWLRTARVTFLDRSITFLVPKGSNVVQTFNLTGGYDALVFSRNVTVVSQTPPAGNVEVRPVFAVIPNQSNQYVEIQIEKQVGSADTEQAPAFNNFGYGFDPNKRPSPEWWSGADLREFTVTNNSNQDVKVVITFTLVLL
jgi:hypothetical protein